MDDDMLKVETLKAEERAAEARKLGHDLRSNLSVLVFGLEALAGVRDDPAQFHEIRTMMQEQGVTPMMTLIDRLVSVASRS